jgi:hypothetical protein
MSCQLALAGLQRRPAVKTLLLTCACAVLISAPALACRGTAEYPELALKLAALDMSVAEKEVIATRFKEGEALHQRGHQLDDAALRQESLKILDEIKAKLTR